MTTEILPNNKKKQNFYNIHASDSRFILNSDSFSKIENQESEKLFLEITKVNLYKNPQKKAFTAL